MANINYTITLTAEGGLAGPSYAVYYSNDCVIYTASVSSPVDLPNIGSIAVITIPDTSTCINFI